MKVYPIKKQPNGLPIEIFLMSTLDSAALTDYIATLDRKSEISLTNYNETILLTLKSKAKNLYSLLKNWAEQRGWTIENSSPVPVPGEERENFTLKKMNQGSKSPVIPQAKHVRIFYYAFIIMGALVAISLVLRFNNVNWDASTIRTAIHEWIGAAWNWWRQANQRFDGRSPCNMATGVCTSPAQHDVPNE